MNSSFYSQKTNSDSNFWGRWSGKKEGRSEGVNAQDEPTNLPQNSWLCSWTHCCCCYYSTSTSTTTTTPTTTNCCYYWYPVGSPRSQEVQNLLKSKAPKLPKAAALRLEIKISLEKALRGGNWAKGRGTVLIQLP